jgi:ABC-type cobalamin/Fe3+-siderophores transport system ATPase subunit
LIGHNGAGKSTLLHVLAASMNRPPAISTLLAACRLCSTLHPDSTRRTTDTRISRRAECFLE